MDVLGGIFYDPRRVDDVAAILDRPERFHSQRHRLSYGAMLHLRSERVAISIDNVRNELRRTDDLDGAGTGVYLVECRENIGSAYDILKWATAVREMDRRRRLIHLITQVRESAYDSDVTVDDALRALVDYADSPGERPATRKSLADFLTEKMDRDAERSEKETLGFGGDKFLKVIAPIDGIQPGYCVMQIKT